MHHPFANIAIVAIAAVSTVSPSRLVAQSGEAGGAARPQFSRQNVFSIPFAIDPAQDPARQPVEVRLYVSVDSGRTWHLSGRAQPDKRGFTFGGRRDGPHWFALQTVDRQGAAHPPKITEPGMIVVVDTQLPKLEIAGERGDAGQIVARWKATDPNLDPKTLRIRYQNTSGGPWSDVAVDRSERTAGVIDGEATWWPRPAGATGTVTLHAEVADEAGNLATSRHEIKPDDDEDEGPSIVDRSRSGAGPNSAHHAADRAAGPPRSVGPESDRSIDARRRHDTAPEESAGTTSPDRLVSERRARRAGDTDSASPGAADRRRPPADRDTLGGAPSRSMLPGPPPGERPRVVGSRRIALAYDLSGVGPSGVAKVELWGTRDGGRSWQSYGVDGDNRSPFDVTVREDGLYGFRIVVQNRAGAGARVPERPADAQLWVSVDTQPPKTEITSTERSGDRRAVAIAWRADDRTLALRPITLLYSLQPGGPWSTIVSGMENSGEFTWRLGEGLPDRAYVRVEAKDEAGNIGFFETVRPVPLDGSQPDGRLRDARAVGIPTPHNRYVPSGESP